MCQISFLAPGLIEWKRDLRESCQQGNLGQPSRIQMDISVSDMSAANRYGSQAEGLAINLRDRSRLGIDRLQRATDAFRHRTKAGYGAGASNERQAAPVTIFEKRTYINRKEPG